MSPETTPARKSEPRAGWCWSDSVTSCCSRSQLLPRPKVAPSPSSLCALSGAPAAAAAASWHTISLSDFHRGHGDSVRSSPVPCLPAAHLWQGQASVPGTAVSALPPGLPPYPGVLVAALSSWPSSPGLLDLILFFKDLLIGLRGNLSFHSPNPWARSKPGAPAG